MPHCSPLLLLATLQLGVVPAHAAPPPASGRYHIVLSQRPVEAGEHVALHLAPPPPEGARVIAWITVGTAGHGLPGMVYRAPYVIPPGTPPVRVDVTISAPGVREAASVEIELQPGSAAGAEECLGPGQTFSTVAGTIEPGFQLTDPLPAVVRSVEPDYPRSAYARGLEQTIVVAVLVCRTGRVLDAYAVPVTNREGEPIEQDPKLVQAALAAARQYLFSPGMVAGQPIATWVHVPIRFAL